MSDSDRARPVFPGLRRKLGLARLALAWERVWPSAWPALGIAGLFLVLALLDALPLLPAWLHAAVLLVLALGFGAAVFRAIRRFTAPDRLDARRRLEQASGLGHRPLAAMEDTLAVGTGDAETTALWRLHQQRMARLVHGLRVGLPAPGLARRDPWSLRGALLILLAVGLTAGWADPDERIARALSPNMGTATAQVPVSLDLWITPPDYTGLAPMFPTRIAMAAEGAGTAVPPAPLKVPAGSKLAAQAQGPNGGQARLIAGSETFPFERIDRASSRIEKPLTESGRLAVEIPGATLGAWTIEIVPDNPPAIAFEKPPHGTLHSATGISFVAEDDYGLAGARAEIRRSYEGGDVIGREMTTLELQLPGRNVTSARESTFHDLAPHRWAGMPVVIELVATDAIGQEGRSETVAFTLPERTFENPVARAIIEQRKRLTEEPHGREVISRALTGIAADPGAYMHDSVVFLALITARSRLMLEPGEGAVEPLRDLLWDTALRLEDGRVSLAERELRRAQEALMKALAENASDEELERLMAELRRALDNYLRAMAEQMMRNPDQQQVQEFDPSTMQMMQSGDLQRMLDQIRDMMRSGARDAAREMLSRLQQMMENMRAMGAMQMRNPGQQGGGPMQQMQQMIQRQQELMDRSFRQQMQGMQPGQGGAMDQRALQQMLEQFRQQMQGMQPGQGQGPGPGEFLDRANEAMERAARALEGGQPGDAVGPQGEALENLRQAGRGIMQQMMERFARESGMGEQRRQRPGQPSRDPLGREIMGDDADSSDVRIPDESAVQRAREILDELRRRSGQQFRPRIELDYIERLLDRF